MRWGLSTSGPRHCERHLAWLLAAGLDSVALNVLPRIGFPADADPTVRPYLESTVWPELWESAVTHGAEAGLSTAALDEVHHLLTPADPRYVMNEPGYFVVHPTILATARKT